MTACKPVVFGCGRSGRGRRRPRQIQDQLSGGNILPRSFLEKGFLMRAKNLDHLSSDHINLKQSGVTMADLRSMKKLQMAVQAARLYYGCDESQARIALKLKISRPQVSRLLQLAREQGIVTIHVNNPPGVHTALEQLFVDYFGIKHAVIVPLLPPIAKPSNRNLPPSRQIIFTRSSKVIRSSGFPGAPR